MKPWHSLTHGFTQRKTNRDWKKLRFYNTWQAMLQRCLNPKCKLFPNYGGRGIKVCKRWMKFENFRDDMWKAFLDHGRKYGFGRKYTSLHRIENEGNYGPNNCAWATLKEQNRHTRQSTKTENYEEHNHWRKLIHHALEAIMNGRVEYSKHEKYFGCSVIELRNYIQSLWEPWMNWNNYGKGLGKWNIEHIDQVRQFDLSIEENRYKCFYYKNLKPLRAKDNNNSRRVKK